MPRPVRTSCTSWHNKPTRCALAGVVGSVCVDCSSHTSLAPLICVCVWPQRRNDLLWLAIVGVTEHLIHESIDTGSYRDLLSELSNQVSRLNIETTSRGPAGSWHEQICCPLVTH